jgi:hypothetical protein
MRFPPNTDGLLCWFDPSNNRVVTAPAPGTGASVPSPVPPPNPPPVVTPPSAHFAQFTGGHSTKEVQNGVVVGDGFCHLDYLSPVDANNHRVRVTVMLSGIIAGEDNVPRAGERPHIFPDYEDTAGRPAAHFNAVELVQIPGTDLWQCTIDTFPAHGQFYMNITVNGDQPANPGANRFVRGLEKDSAYHITEQVLHFWVSNGEVFGPAPPGGVQPPPPPGPQPPPPPPPPAASHFASLDPATISSITSEVVNGSSTGGDGIAVVHTTVSTSGSNATVRFTFYLGPWGSDDNTPGATQQPYLFPNYINGAESGRPAADYQPLALTEVPGSNRTLWEVTISTFPTSGTFVYTLTKDGNDLTTFSNKVPVEGLERDSSYHVATQSLQATYDSGTGQVFTPPAP